MNLSDLREQQHQDAYNKGWNAAASDWDLGSPKLGEPKTSYTGEKRESFIEGYRDSQDSLLLNQKIKP